MPIYFTINIKEKENGRHNLPTRAKNRVEQNRGGTASTSMAFLSLTFFKYLSVTVYFH